MEIILGDSGESKLVAEKLINYNINFVYFSTSRPFRKLLDYKIPIHFGNCNYSYLKNYVIKNKVNRIIDFNHSKNIHLSNLAKHVSLELQCEYIYYTNHNEVSNVNNCYYFNSQSYTANALSNVYGNILLTVPFFNCFAWNNISKDRLFFYLNKSQFKNRALNKMNIDKSHLIINNNLIENSLKIVFKNFNIRFMVLNSNNDVTDFSNKIKLSKENKVFPIIIETKRRSSSIKHFSDLNNMVNYLISYRDI